MDNIVGRLKLLFPHNQLQLIIGSLMGDARLECRSKSIRAKHTARLRIHQSDKQKDYVFWKYQQLKDLVLKGPRHIKAGHDIKRNKDHFSWYFHTKSTAELGLIHSLFYENKIKIVPSKLLKILDPLGLAVWYMDDGSNNGKNITLNTHGFSIEEQKILQNWLKNKFDINATIVKDRSKFKLAIGSYEYHKFLDIVRPHIAPSMAYKIYSPRNDLISSELRDRAISI